MLIDDVEVVPVSVLLKMKPLYVIVPLLNPAPLGVPLLLVVSTEELAVRLMAPISICCPAESTEPERVVDPNVVSSPPRKEKTSSALSPKVTPPVFRKVTSFVIDVSFLRATEYTLAVVANVEAVKDPSKVNELAVEEVRVDRLVVEPTFPEKVTSPDPAARVRD